VTTLASATTFSDNSVYAQVGLKVGPPKIARLAERMGIRTPVSRNCAMTLGGLREGVTPLDMAHAYETFATNGLRVSGSLGPPGGPVGIREVCRLAPKSLTKCDDTVDVNDTRKTRVLPEGVARTATSILATVVQRGTAVRARLNEFAAGKTGTTENYGDAWFVGFTRRLTVAVWVGYPSKLKPMETEYRGKPVAGGTYPADIWRDFMVAASKLLQQREAAERERKGLPPKTDTTPAPLPPGTPTTPGSPEVPQGEPPAPSGGAERPEAAPQPATGGAPRQDGGSGGGGGGGGGGEAPEPTPTPTPEPAPQQQAPPDNGSGGAAAAPPA